MPHCPLGKVSRDAYRRRSYTKSDGTTVKASFVSASCVSDTGKPGKTPSYKKVLPKPDPNVSLSKFGYFLARQSKDRKTALRKAAKAHGDLAVLRRVNLLRNLTGNEENRKKMSQDVLYLSNRYAKTKSKTKSKTKNKTK